MATAAAATGGPPPRILSPYDPSTSNCLPPGDSDCGSSSGVGGMKNPELISSDEGSEAHNGHVNGTRPNPAAAAFRPMQALASTRPTVAGTPQPLGLGGLMPYPPPPQPLYGHPPPMTGVPPSNTDLFVHVQIGETLSLMVGTEMQLIKGPATIRMVGESGVPPQALPLMVPPGHMVHQIVDEQGILRHLILSPEVNPHFPQTNNNATSARAQPAHFGGQHNNNNNFYTVNRKWSHGNHSAGGGHSQQRQAHQHTAASPPPTVTTESSEMDTEEWDRVREMLTRIQAPTIMRITHCEADIEWQELDTSEACSPGGPFPQIDASEFTYNIVLFESDKQPGQMAMPRYISNFRCEPETGNKLRLCRLRPDTEYHVQLRASLEERELHGDPSQMVQFRTAPSVPDPVPLPRLESRLPDSLSIAWRAPADNGAPITTYAVYACKSTDSDDTPACKVWEGSGETARLTSLTPSTSYRIRVTARNRLGESDASAPLIAATRPDKVPQAPHPPSVVSVSARACKLTWVERPEHTYTLEQLEAWQSVVTVVKERAVANSAVVNDLLPDSEYRFRLIAYNSEGESPRSEWTLVKTTRDKQEKDRVITPCRPYIIENPRRSHIEIGWKCNGAKDREFTFHLEGAPQPSTAQAQPKWRSLYRGPSSVYLISDEDLCVFRVQAISRRQLVSDWSAVLKLGTDNDTPVVALQEKISSPSQLSPPRLSVRSGDELMVMWDAVDSIPSSTTLMYELRRVDGCTRVIYSGCEPRHLIAGLEENEHVELQVRAVVLSDAGRRFESPWSGCAGGGCGGSSPSSPVDGRSIDGRGPGSVSRTTSVCSSSALGSGLSSSVVGSSVSLPSPHSLQVSSDKTLLRWSGDDGMRYRVRCVPDQESFGEVCGETSDRRFSLADLKPNSDYSVTIQSFLPSTSECSVPSECLRLHTPHALPPRPSNVVVEGKGSHELLIRWSCGEEKGTSAILQYHVRVSRDAEVLRETCILPPSSSSNDECEYRVDGLDPDTVYCIELSAENSIGRGETARLTGRTRRPPPDPPRIDCDPEPTTLRLKWKPAIAQRSPPLTYKVVRLSDNDAHIAVYEGENNSTRVRGLQENTAYRFQIRAGDKLTGHGAWSAVYEFHTTLAPPPALRTQPTSTPSGQGYYQIEWQQAIPKQQQKTVFYRLQLVDVVADSRWTTIYEGPQPSYCLRALDYPGAVQLRVMCVRREGEGELHSSPSPVLYIANSKRSDGANGMQGALEEREPNTYDKVKRFVIDRSIATAAIIIFVMCSFFAALCFENIADTSKPIAPPPIAPPPIIAPPRPEL